MGIVKTSDIMFVDTQASLPMNADAGSVAYAQDVQKHYMFNGTDWIFIGARQAYVTGVLKPGAFPYLSKAVTASGTAIFWITDNGLSTGNAVFNNVYADSITITPYGTNALYQMSSPTVASDKKSVTITVSQVTSVLLGLIQSATAANGVDCRLLVLGD